VGWRELLAAFRLMGPIRESEPFPNFQTASRPTTIFAGTRSFQMTHCATHEDVKTKQSRSRESTAQYGTFPRTFSVCTLTKQGRSDRLTRQVAPDSDSANNTDSDKDYAREYA
jgi:hypothetical protein